LAEHLCNLKENGLNLIQGERITKEQVMKHLQNIDLRELAEILSEDKGKTSSIKVMGDSSPNHGHFP
jgi:hypothetical protein